MTTKRALQAIETRVLPVTHTKPTRIVAETASGIRLVMSKNSAEDATTDQHDDQVHRVVAQRLADKLKWADGQEMVCGSTKRGYVFVFRDNA